MCALIDSGSCVSVMPNICFSGVVTSPGPLLQAVNNSAIACHGQAILPFVMDELRSKFNFLMANVNRPIIGADFLEHFSCTLDFSTKNLSIIKEL